MEPLKALTLVAIAGVVSLAGTSAAGFYIGYSAGRSTGAANRTVDAEPSAAVSVNGSGANLSLKPVLEDIRAVSAQLDAMNASLKAPASSDPQSKAVIDEVRALAKQIDTIKVASSSGVVQTRGGTQIDLAPITKAVSEEVRGLSKQIDSLRANGTANPASQGAPAQSATADYRGNFDSVEEHIKALAEKIDKQDQKANKAVIDEIHAVATSLQSQEPKAPKGLIDEVRAIAASVQAQEPYGRRAIIDEIKTAVATLQNAEPRLPKTLIDEIKAAVASGKGADTRSQPSVIDQIKVLNASIDGLRSRMPDTLGDDLKRVSQQVQVLADRQSGGDRSKAADSSIAAEIGQLRQLVSTATEQFGKCQSQLATLSTASFTPAQTPAAAAQPARGEATSVVFYDNVMLRKDQEKQYDEIGVKLSLQSVSSRQVKLGINRQAVGLAFGERKVFRSQDVECEMNLMETNLSDAQARVSISCKR